MGVTLVASGENTGPICATVAMRLGATMTLATCYTSFIYVA